jgi:hypothetical protein
MTGIGSTILNWKAPSVKTLMTEEEVIEMEQVIIASKSGCGCCKHVYS